jgi:catechol 2,3-dioxygenase-like lactoylglutathione lyase family enzyme
MSSPDHKAFHLSLRVRDLARSVDFYERLLGVAPAKHYADYAKFEVADPPVVLSLEPAKSTDRAGLDHLGVRLASRNHLIDMSSRIAERGLDFQHLQGVECCYARQSKIYANDPDGNLVEVYTVDADLVREPSSTAAPAMACHTDTEGGTFTHLLPADFPLPLPAADTSLLEIKLQGTFNAQMSKDTLWQIVKECRRTLAPGGRVTTHILAADQEVPGDMPRLPEPASHVRRAPTEPEVLNAFEEAGFVGLELKRLSHAAVFAFQGAEFREFLLVATAPQPTPVASEGKQLAVYKGPFPTVKLESGTTFLRGRRTEISGVTAALLRSAPYADSFVVLTTGGGCGV